MAAEHGAAPAGTHLPMMRPATAEGIVIGTPVRERGRIVDFRLEHLNDVAAAAIGPAPERVIGQRFTGLWPGIAATGLLDAYLAVAATGRPLARTFYDDEGSGRGGYFRIFAERLGDGIVIRFTSFADTTLLPPGGRGQDNAVLLRAALDAAFDGFALLTVVRDADVPVDFEFTYLNQVGARLGGRALSETVGGRMTDVWPSTVTNGLLARYLAVAATGETYLTEYVDGAHGQAWEIKATRVAPDVVALSFRDITSRVRQQEQIATSEAQARQAADRMAALQEVTASLASAVAVDDVLEVMERRVRPSIAADRLTVLLLDDDRLVVRHTTGPRAPDGPAGGFPLDGPSAVADTVARGVPQFFANRAALLAEYPWQGGQVAGGDEQAWSLLPLTSAGRPIGAVAAGYRRTHPFGPDERKAQIVLAELCAQALERALLFEAQKSIAADLQRALLPNTLPVLHGARHAVRYLPWTQGTDVGGDWYDVLRIRPGTVCVVIGDVAGHSTSAAATMGQIRNALRAYAIEGHSPTSVVERVNRLVARLDPYALATCCYLELHLDEGTATAVLAGHLPPILRRDGGTAEPLGLRLGVPLGVDPDASYADTTVLLPPRSALLLYTDGLVEDRRYRIDRGMADLCRVVAAVDSADPEVIVERVLSSDVGPSPRSDDVALLAITFDGRPATPQAGPAEAVRHFPSDARSVSAARRFAGDLLMLWGFADLADTARLLLGEVLTNAVQHTVGEVRVRLAHRVRRLRVEVTDRSDRLPGVRDLDPEAESGRGLHIVRTLADAWGCRTVESGGKTVWFELTTGAV